MSRVKIVVNHMPEFDRNCPFAIVPPSGFQRFPCVCDLKRDKCDESPEFRDDLYHNCDLSLRRPCELLQEIGG